MRAPLVGGLYGAHLLRLLPSIVHVGGRQVQREDIGSTVILNGQDVEAAGLAVTTDVVDGPRIAHHRSGRVGRILRMARQGSGHGQRRGPGAWRTATHRPHQRLQTLRCLGNGVVSRHVVVTLLAEPSAQRGVGQQTLHLTGEDTGIHGRKVLDMITVDLAEYRKIGHDRRLAAIQCLSRRHAEPLEGARAHQQARTA